MAKVFDEVLDSDIQTDSLEDVGGETAQPIEAKQEPKPEDDLPEKYKGKSVKDIIAMHQEAEKLIGKQGSEVGELRRVVDDFIKAQSSKDLTTKEQETELTDEDIFVNPKEAINKAIDNHPTVKEAKLAAQEMKRVETLNKLQSDFPDLMDVVSNQSFQEWVASSRVRTELFARAETQFDYEAAKELISTWKDKQEISRKTAETSKADRDLQLKAADVGTNSSSEPVSKKKYRRSDIIKLMQTDRDRYEAMQDEIMAAYAEGRVV